MEKLPVLKFFILTSILLFCMKTKAQNPVNWTEKQLMEPADLATAINMNKDVPVIIRVGPGAAIPNAIEVGTVIEGEGMEKLKSQLKAMDKDKKIVVYCGCCPFEHCPNVRPAIGVLKEMKFSNYYLLNLPHNIKRDWIDKGYPVLKSQ